MNNTNNKNNKKNKTNFNKLRKEVGRKKRKESSSKTESPIINKSMKLSELRELSELSELSEPVITNEKEKVDEIVETGVLNMENDTTNEETIGNIFSGMDDMITITEKQLVPEYERVYKDDSIYIQDLENEFIAELPLENQNNKYYQQQISETVKNIIDLKNKGQLLLDRDDRYPYMLDEYVNHNFYSSLFIPVVLDKQKIYQEIDLSEGEGVGEGNGEVAEVKEVGEAKSGSTFTFSGNIINELFEIWEIEKNFMNDKIKFEKYVKSIHKMTMPFISLSDLDGKNVGYKINLKNDTNLIRFDKIYTKYWNERVGLGPEYIWNSDDKTKKTLIAGDDINIVGFLSLPKKYSHVNKIGDIVEIKPAKKTIIVVKNHGLNEGEHILIKNSNELDGVFKVDEIIDANSFLIDFDTSGFDDANVGGEIYGESALKINTINIGEKDVSHKKNIEYDPAANNLFLFNTFEVNEDAYFEILRKIIPTLTDIIEYNPELKNVKFLENINQIFEKYRISYNELHIEQFDIIKKYLEKNVGDEEKYMAGVAREYIEYEKNLERNREKKFNFSNTIFDDKFFYGKNITELYGEYPLRNNPYDSLEKRLKWINSHIDFGNYYYTHYAQEKKKDVDRKEVDGILKEINSMFSTTTKTYEKEQKMDKYFKKCSKFVKEYKTMDDKKEKYTSVDTMLKDQTKYEEGDLAIAIDNPVSKIYEYVLNKNGKGDGVGVAGWVFKENAKELDSIIYLCGLEDENIKNISSIDCVYTLDGCKSKRLYKYEKEYNNLKTALDNYSALISADSNKKYDDAVLKEYKNILSKFNENRELKKAALVADNKKISISAANESNKKNSRSKVIPISISKILNQISQIKNTESRRHLMYALLEKDGLTIGDDIYSKKYNGYMMCGHYNYLRKEDYTNNNLKKEQIRMELLEKFSDNGKALAGENVCRNCGEYLTNVDFDEAPLFDETGQPIIMRETIVDEEKEYLLRKKKLEEKILCNSPIFKKDLISKGFKLEQLEQGIKICQILQSITYKIGIELKKEDFMDIVVDTLEQYGSIPPYQLYYRKSIADAKLKGVPEIKIKKMDEEKVFENAYKKFFILKKYSIICARLLVVIQTSIPPYIRRKTMTGCTFTAWDGKFGVEYLSCILLEMKVFDAELRILLGNVIDDIFKLLRTFSEKPVIRNLYAKRVAYDKTLRRDATVLRKEVVEEIVEFGVDGDQGSYYSHSRYLAYLIRKIMEAAIKKEEGLYPTFSKFTNELLPENVCCPDPIHNYVYSRRMNEDSGGELNKLFEETYELAELYPAKINKGTITKLYIEPDRIISEENLPPAENIGVSDQIMMDKFKHYCFTGYTAGETHYFSGGGGTDKCAKCGKSLEEIAGMKIDAKLFNKLLEDITEKNTNVYKGIGAATEIDAVFYKMKEEEDYELEIDNFIEKISKTLNFDKDTAQKYTELLKSLGNYNNMYSFDDMNGASDSASNSNSNDQRRYKFIKLIDAKETTRIQLLKTYIQYFRKYISMVANNVDTDFINKIPYVDNATSKELQKYILETEIEPIKRFITVDNTELFQKFKFEYSQTDINNIYGSSDKYNETWNKILKKSNFNLKNAADVLMYILIAHLNSFIDVAGNDGRRILAEFIVAIFDMILLDTDTFDMSKKEYEKYKTAIYYEKYCKYSFQLANQNLEFLKTTFNLSVEDGAPDVNTFIELDEQMREEGAAEEAVDRDLESMARKALGEGASEKELQSFVDSYRKNKMEDDALLEREFAYKQLPESEYVLETGDEYSEMDQSLEADLETD